MESLLVRLMIIAAIGKLGLAALAGGPCMSRECVTNIERASRNILRIEWKPISVFTEEGKRFLGTKNLITQH